MAESGEMRGDREDRERQQDKKNKAAARTAEKGEGQKEEAPAGKATLQEEKNEKEAKISELRFNQLLLTSFSLAAIEPLTHLTIIKGTTGNVPAIMVMGFVDTLALMTLIPEGIKFFEMQNEIDKLEVDVKKIQDQIDEFENKN